MSSKAKQRVELKKSASMLPKEPTGARKSRPRSRFHVKTKARTRECTGFEALEFPAPHQRAASPAYRQSITFSGTTKLLDYIRAFNLSQESRKSLVKTELNSLHITELRVRTSHATISNIAGMVITKKPLNKLESSLLQNQQHGIRIPVAAFNQEAPTQINSQEPCGAAVNLKKPTHQLTHYSNYSIINLNFSATEKAPPQRTRTPQRTRVT